MTFSPPFSNTIYDLVPRSEVPTLSTNSVQCGNCLINYKIKKIKLCYETFNNVIPKLKEQYGFLRSYIFDLFQIKHFCENAFKYPLTKSCSLSFQQRTSYK